MSGCRFDFAARDPRRDRGGNFQHRGFRMGQPRLPGLNDSLHRFGQRRQQAGHLFADPLVELCLGRAQGGLRVLLARRAGESRWRRAGP